jgi:hypothetical protein
MKRYGFDIVAMWEARRPERTEFVYLLRWPDEQAKTRARKAFTADREWDDIKKETRGWRNPGSPPSADRLLI